jgi:hypothetical protein
VTWSHSCAPCSALICSIGLSISLAGQPPNSPPQGSSDSQQTSAATEPPGAHSELRWTGSFPDQIISDPPRSSAFRILTLSGLLTKALWDAPPALKKAKIKVYGWINPGGDVSTSKDSNIPESDAIVPNKLEMDQAVLRFERVPDSMQTNHIDWGFRLTTMYGIDYRWTTAQGWFSEQLLKRNSLYGADPEEAYGLVYFPHVAQGMMLKVGRYISPPVH